MTEPQPPPTVRPAEDPPPVVRNLELKATLLLLLMFLLLLGSGAYLLYARGVFEASQRLILITDDSEGVAVGMNMTFAGFAIGRVGRIDLGDDGNARILIDVPRKDARWLRTSSVFTIERGLVGGTNIRAHTGMLEDPPLADGAERHALRGDAAAEIPLLTASIRDLLENLKALTAGDAALVASLAHLQGVTERLRGPQGALGVLLGSDADARRLLERTDTLLARADVLAAGLDRLVANADRQVFGQIAGPNGTTAQRSLVADIRSTVNQLNGLLGEARSSLTRVDAVLVEAQAIASNSRQATTDLGRLRSEVEASLHKVDHLLNEINSRWPFAREAEIRLP